MNASDIYALIQQGIDTRYFFLIKSWYIMLVLD